VPFLRAFGDYLPSGVVSNAEIAALTGVEPEWIRTASGIEERRFAAEEETVADLGWRAAVDCLDRAGLPPASVGMALMASGTSARRFPGPSVSVAQRLGISGAPAIDLPIPSAGSLFGLPLAAHGVPVYNNELVIGVEIMSRVALREGNHPGTAVLFGDGAGACLVSASGGVAEFRDGLIPSDGALNEDLHLEFECPVEMNGRAVILQVPTHHLGLLGRNQLALPTRSCATRRTRICSTR
jgi:3-oxoacyl-[acyl-carrier-protein] synthase-3